MTIFGERLKGARINKGWNQEELAKKAQLSQASISQFEKGLRLPTPANIQKLAELLEIDRNYLAGENEGEFEKMMLMRNLKDLSPDSIRKINNYAVDLKSIDSAKKGRK